MQSMRKGFTLIELMIVIAIIAIIAAIAIPNLMQSRIRANEATAVSSIKQYATAQVTFQIGKQGRAAANTTTGVSGFADNFRNLFYAPPVGQTVPMALVSQAVADAFGTGPLGGAAATNTTTIAIGGAAAYQGFFFNEPQALTPAYYANNFAILASPAHSTNTGNNAYWVDQQGTVYMLGLAAGLSQTGGAISAGLNDLATPSTAIGTWVVL